MEGAALLDLVCGPVSPLPETHQRYRLVSHLGTGGQAEVYRAVRVSGGISSAPVTVKVFRRAGDRPMSEQLRSWDKGDAVLMDLNSRGVPGICRRADGFYGPPPYQPGQPASGDPVPYQVLDYLHGVTLREYVAQRYGVGGSAPRLDAVVALTALAGVLRALHLPGDPRACPVLHMDVKPSNVMVLTGGEVRLIDFTGARYHWRDHITSVAYTLEAGGPEAFSGNVGPAYDVHGFGAVAYYLVTGAFPRMEAAPPDGVTAPPWAVLRRHPLLDAHPALREHLLAPVADRPEDRPSTADLPGWVRRLAELVAAASCPDVGVDWGGARLATGRAAVAPLAGTETGAFQRIEKLERELVQLRTALGAPVGAYPAAAPNPSGPGGPGPAVAGAAGHGAPPAGPSPQGFPAASRNGAHSSRAPEPTRVAPASGPPGPGRNGATGGSDPTMRAQPASGDGGIRGVAAVPAKEPDPTLGDQSGQWAGKPVDPRQDLRRPDLATVLNRGSEITGVGVMFLFVCWGIWSVASGRGGFVDKFLVFVFVLAIGVGVFVLSRLVGRLIWEKLLGRVRRNARGAHLVTGVYLAAAGLGFLNQTPWAVELWGWLKSLV